MAPSWADHPSSELASHQGSQALHIRALEGIQGHRLDSLALERSQALLLGSLELEGSHRVDTCLDLEGRNARGLAEAREEGVEARRQVEEGLRAEA